MTGGWSLGLEIDEITGRSWDLLRAEDQAESIKLLAEDQPELLIVAPPCTKFSCLENLSKKPVPENEMQSAREMVDHGIRMCRKEMELGKAFMFEHPASASSWKLDNMRELRKTQGVEEFVLHMCEFG